MLGIRFTAMLLQQFTDSDIGTRLRPVGAPSDCSFAARAALIAFSEHPRLRRAAQTWLPQGFRLLHHKVSADA
jgi:hypothetical protein